VLYYSDGGPGPASKLLAVQSEPGASDAAWWCAPGWRWQVKGGWREEPEAQGRIRLSGEFFYIEEEEVLEVQHQMLLQHMEFRMYPK
jgi:hypothetical protein